MRLKIQHDFDMLPSGLIQLPISDHFKVFQKCSRIPKRLETCQEMKLLFFIVINFHSNPLVIKVILNIAGVKTSNVYVWVDIRMGNVVPPRVITGCNQIFMRSRDRSLQKISCILRYIVNSQKTKPVTVGDQKLNSHALVRDS